MWGTGRVFCWLGNGFEIEFGVGIDFLESWDGVFGGRWGCLRGIGGIGILSRGLGN